MIYLTDAAEKVVKRLAAKYPDGKLFRNQRGCPWSGTALTHKCEELGEKLGFTFFPYALRHTWITEALERGEDALTVAILAGHRDTTMVAKVYSHLNRKPDYLRAAMRRARGA
jgi:integrase